MIVEAVRFREDWNGFSRGQKAKLTPSLMAQLVRYGKAVACEPEPEKKPAKKKPAARQKKTEKAVQV